ncbi:hypothetical protein F5B20DRAFT_527400 [Whalleya microplaca]|nr:hypothetical protein F5B20DRAFT_527400 [Whalleya microplaca]
MVLSLVGDPSRSGPLMSSRATAATRYSILITLCALFSTVVAAQQSLPYIPTTIFLPGSNPGLAQDNATGSVAYIFSHQDDSVELLALNYSSNIQASSLSLQTLSSSLPFLQSNSTAFTPSIADNGSLIIYAGDCSSPSDSEIWTFNPSANGDTSSPWRQVSTSKTVDANDTGAGPSFLGGSFSFSTTLEPEITRANTYVYGGMCPNATSDGSKYQSMATYSNQMYKISPSPGNADQYTVSSIASKGPPVAEAGFTFTGLSPSISNRSGTVTQQVNYVLLGGHTQHAFINMSTAAIWNLPEESWGFISNIKVAGSGTANTELAVKSTIDSIDSRSGHTAVVNEDGTSLIILGGWVGDLTQAANPQLAILEIGADYGGSGDWQWTVPDTQPRGSGMYGHGAALLPGNIMMVYGGYSISSSGSKVRRQNSSGNNVPMFLNLTSMSWTDDYTNPTYTEVGVDGNSDSTDDSTKIRLGLGLGIGLGLAAIIAAILLYFCYRRRLRHRRTIRDSAIRALAQDTSRFLPHDDEMMEHNQGSAGWYTGGPDPYMRGGNTLGYQSLQSGRGSMDNSRQSWFGDLPPVSIARKPVPPRGARGQYQPHPMGAYDSPSGSSRAGAIHPIIEADEDGSMHDGDIVNEPISPVRESERYSDPFVTPTQERPQISFPPSGRSSLTPSPEGKRPTTDPEVQDWMTDVDAADALLSGRAGARSAAVGRGSPTRRGTVKSTRSLGGQGAEDEDRTGSNISESNRSNLTPSRSNSVLSHFRAGFGVAALATATAAMEGRGGSSGSSSGTPSYNTARSSNFPALQAEGPALLFGKDRDESPGSPSKSKPRRSWLGSLRRVFSGSTPSPPDSMGDVSPMDESFAEVADYDMRLGGLGGIAADGVLRRKGGRGAWEASHQEQGGSSSSRDAASHPSGEPRATPGYDEEWDIEKAVENRLVQVLFTVPKERLRVVNAEPDIESAKDVVVVDPEKEDAPAPAPVVEAKPLVTKPTEEERGDLGIPPPLLLPVRLPLPSPSPVSDKDSNRSSPEPALPQDPEKEALRKELEGEWEETLRSRDKGKRPEDTPEKENEASRLLGSKELGMRRPRTPGRRSMSRSPIRDSMYSEGDICSAEAVTFERPRTRVLAMVESIESLSRDNSPASSPTR